MLRSVVSKYDGFMTCPRCLVIKAGFTLPPLSGTRAKAPCKYVAVCYREGVDTIWRGLVQQRVHATLDLRAEVQKLRSGMRLTAFEVYGDWLDYYRDFGGDCRPGGV
jgi:hypothetical protein